MDIIQDIQKRLFSEQDLKYQAFHAKLVPTLPPDRIIGVRTPQLRKLAKEFSKHNDIDVFLNALPHDYYDERNLHGFIISEIKDYDRSLAEIERLLSVVDNWATCDLLSPKAFKVKSNRQRLIVDVRRWMSSPEPYIRRFGIEMLMSHFLDDAFDVKYLKWVADAATDHYYVKMMIAWYFATALAKQYEATIPYIEQGRLTSWIHSKTIQKAIESYRITDEQKAYLRTLRSVQHRS
ncbi:MAG: DNA alkylation repair protein [Bacteroidales bacterium]|nr:DNA alkylation repair protein [Bacteroidales bacterium]